MLCFCRVLRVDVLLNNYKVSPPNRKTFPSCIAICYRKKTDGEETPLIHYIVTFLKAKTSYFTVTIKK